MQHEKAKRFITENARPLELACYQYLFEHGDPQRILDELARYQNADGGFGHGLEADNWNPLSNPIATNDALITLHSFGLMDACPPLTDGMARYLTSQDSFDQAQQRWLFAIDSNVEYPHAVWWEKKGDGISGFNPTVSLAAFLCCRGGDTACETILRQAFDWLATAEEVSGDGLKCFLLAWELLSEHGLTNIIDLDAAKALLCGRLLSTICKDTAQYGVAYVPLPSDFFAGTYQAFITPEIRPLIDAEKAVLDKLQADDGGFDISWQWYNDYPEFAQARRWWRPKITLNKLLLDLDRSAACPVD